MTNVYRLHLVLLSLSQHAIDESCIAVMCTVRTNIYKSSALFDAFLACLENVLTTPKIPVLDTAYGCVVDVILLHSLSSAPSFDYHIRSQIENANTICPSIMCAVVMFFGGSCLTDIAIMKI